MNKEITIYELLGLIKDEQAPERIVYDNYIWDWAGDDYCTILKTEKEQFLITGMYYTWLSDFLNDKVEIIEEDNKIKKIDNRYYDDVNECYVGKKELGENILIDKINELIDEVNALKENNK